MALIRKATEDDSGEIVRVHVETWRDAYRGIVADSYLATLSLDERQAKWLERLGPEASQRSLIFAASEAGEIVGFISGGKNRDPILQFDAELYALYVAPGHQKQGIGRGLARALVGALAKEGCRSLMVGVLAGNASARRFYEAMGGTQVGERSLPIGDEWHAQVFYGWWALHGVAA